MKGVCIQSPIFATDTQNFRRRRPRTSRRCIAQFHFNTPAAEKNSYRRVSRCAVEGRDRDIALQAVSERTTNVNGASGYSTHPLEPLTINEIKQAAKCCRDYVAMLKTGVQPEVRFSAITLKEPAKKSFTEWKIQGSKSDLPREAECIIQVKKSTGWVVAEAVVSLNGKRSSMKSFDEVDGAQPVLTPDDCNLAEGIVKNNEGLINLLMKRYGLSKAEISNLACDPWSVHQAGESVKGLEGRLVQLFLYYKTSKNDNQYAHPIDVVPIVDLYQEKVVQVNMYEDPTAIPTQNNNYHRDLVDKFRDTLKPLHVVQPEGASFSVNGKEVTWEKWRFRVGFNYREGLVLHDVEYLDDDPWPTNSTDKKPAYRPIMHRGSLVEMCVPYADPREPFVRKCAFDVGDYGLGFCANSLALGCDCLGHIQYFDAHLNDSKGNPYTLKNAVCLHEEDFGLLWKHVEYRTGHSESRRSRRLVISFIATVVNYEYAFYWYLYQDGSIKFDIKLTGELSTNVLSPGENPQNPEYGVLVGEGVNAQHHQHMFSARLDLAVDCPKGGSGLVVEEVEVHADETDATLNPCNNAFSVRTNKLTSEKQAKRDLNPHAGRYWTISNPQALNPVTEKPVKYGLLPSSGCGMGVSLLASEDSLVGKRGAFARHALWVTPHRDDEKWPAGNYTVQSTGGKGLEEWTAKDRSVLEEDVVLWHTFGVTHIPRTEDFPVMPVEEAGFALKPLCFFARNPGIDIPAKKDEKSRECKRCDS